MDLWTATKIVLRRWAIVVPALVLTGVVAVVVVSRIAPSYAATGTVEFLASNQANTVNPYIHFDPSLQTTATLVGASVGSVQTRATFAFFGLDSNYKVVAPYDPTRAVLVPSLDISSKASNATVAVATLKRLSAAIKTDLNGRQEAIGAPTNTWIQLRSTLDTKAVKQNGQKTKVLVLIVLLGVAVSVSLAFFAESLTSDSKRKRLALATGSPDTDPESSGPAADADATLLSRALDAMRVALEVADATTSRSLPGPQLEASLETGTDARTPVPESGKGNGNGSGEDVAAGTETPMSVGNGQADGNGSRPAIPTEGIDAKRDAAKVLTEGSITPSGSKTGPLPVARPAEGDRPDEGKRPPTGGRAS